MRMYKTYRIHIQFDNGSNPYYTFGMDEKSFKRELKRWKKDYTLKLQSVSALGTYYYFATEKEMKTC